MAHDVSHLRHLSRVGFGLRADHSFVHGGVVCLPWTGILSPFPFSSSRKSRAPKRMPAKELANELITRRTARGEGRC
jgi:hypothetical protein